LPKYTIQKNVVSSHQEQYEESFDIDDHELWQSLRRNASQCLTEAELKQIPEENSKKIEDWLALYRVLPTDLWRVKHETISHDDKIQWILTNYENDESCGDAEYIHLVVEE